MTADVAAAPAPGTPGGTEPETPVLTVLHLNPASPHVQADSRDVYQMHQRVVALLGLQPGEEKGRELWAQPRPDRLLVQWRRPVDLRWLPDGYTTTHHIVPVRTGWEMGDRVRWALTGNVIRRKLLNRERRLAAREAGIPTPPKVLRADTDEWTRTRLPMLDHHTIACLDRHTATGMQQRTGRRITVTRSRVTGEATVLDPAALSAAILSGVGREKHAGCGLLLVEAVTS